MEQDNFPIPDGINTLKLLWLQEKFKFAQKILYQNLKCELVRFAYNDI